MKVSVLTLGCRVNQSESAVIEASLKGNGITIVDLEDNPDICVVNTCTVTKKSDYNSRQTIRRAARSGAQVFVTGCYSQLNQKDVSDIPGVIRLVDNKDKLGIVGLITNRNPEMTFHAHGRSRPFLKVQDGCNFNCSYCSVPLARGSSKSVPLEDLLDTAVKIVENGFNEIVLTGIHLGTYGQDLPKKITINGLIKALLARTGIHRIRLSSLEINEIDDELLEIMQDIRICRHLHVPLQSGSDKILRLMRRSYNSAFFLKRLHVILSRLGDIGLGTDVITGFPGEGDPEFQETYSLLGASAFTYFHVFPFSPRPGTDAFKMKSRPDGREVGSRADKLLRLAEDKKKAYMAHQVGKTLEIITEECMSGGIVAGTSSNYLKISAPIEEYRKGSVEAVRALRLEKDTLEGVRIKLP